MNEKWVKLLTRAGAEVCKFLAGWLTTADFSQGALVYGGLTVLQILMTVLLGQAPSLGTAARRQSKFRKLVGRL